MYSQRIPTDWANRRCCGDARVVHEIPWSNDIITSNVGFLGDSVVEELGLINYTVFCRVGKNLGDVSIKIFCCHLIGNLAQLTLFPSGHRHYMKQGRRDTSGWPNIRNTSTGDLDTTISAVSHTYRDKCS